MQTQAVKKAVGRRKLKAVILEASCIILFALFMVPFVIVLFNSMRSNAEIMQNAFALPTNLRQLFVNIKTMLSNSTFDYFDSFKDSVIITVFSLISISLISSMAAWVLVRNKSKTCKVIFFVFIAAMCIPFQVIMFPLISWFKAAGNATGVQLLRSHFGMIFAYMGFGVSLSIFIFHGFIKNIPVALEEAAEIDGCSRPGIFFRIVFPLLQPVLVTVLVLNGLWIWNDYLLPLLLLGSNGDVQTIPLAVQVFNGAYVRQWDLVMTSTLLAMLPIIALYLFAQKYIIRGMVEGAVK